MPLALLLLAAVLTACSPGTSAPAPVVQRTPADLAPLPEARTEVAGAMWRARVVVAGGLGADGSRSARVDAFDVREGEWERLPDLPEPRDHLALVVRGERLLAIGGYGDDGATATVWSLGSGDASWRVEAPMPSPRAAMAAGLVRGSVVVAGGAAEGRALATTVVLDGDRWTVGPDLPSAREHVGGAVRGGRLYVVGGRVGGLTGNVDDVASWAPGDDHWRAEQALPSPRGGLAAAATSGGVLCAAGGEEPGGTEDDVVCLLDAGWRAVGRLRVPRHGVAVVPEGRQVHVVGGGPEPGLSVSGAHEVLTTH